MNDGDERIRQLVGNSSLSNNRQLSLSDCIGIANSIALKHDRGDALNEQELSLYHGLVRLGFIQASQPIK